MTNDNATLLPPSIEHGTVRVVFTKEAVVVFKNGTPLHYVSNTSESDPTIGATMKDGTIYAGISPETLKPMYVQYNEMPKKMTWDDAVAHAERLQFRLPTAGELTAIFNNQVQRGVFGKLHEAYWSSDCSPDGTKATIIAPGDCPSDSDKKNKHLVHLVKN